MRVWAILIDYLVIEHMVLDLYQKCTKEISTERVTSLTIACRFISLYVLSLITYSDMIDDAFIPKIIEVIMTADFSGVYGGMCLEWGIQYY